MVDHIQELQDQTDQVTSECSYDAQIKLLQDEIKHKQNTISTYELMLRTSQQSLFITSVLAHESSCLEAHRYATLT